MGDEVLSEAGCGAIEIAAPPQQRVEVDAEPEAVARLRNAARAFARAHGATGDLPGDIALAVTEAATNAILHAYLDREPGTITLICEASRHRLRFRVIDDGCGMRPRPDSPGMGIGLSTIGKLASGMDVRSGDDGAGTEVAITFDAPGVRGPFAAPADAREAALLDAASRIAQSAAWPQEGVERLAELLVGEVGDAVTVDVVDDGVLRRLSARVDGDPELSAWLTDSLPPMKPGTATWDALHGRSPAIVVHDPSRRRPMHGPGERLGLDWWVACALPDRNGRALGIVGIGGRGGRRPVPDDRTVALIAEVAERAAGGLAQARVVDDLRATRRRLEGILEALTEAVTVSTADGRVVWANQAAAEMLGATTPDAIVSASPGSVAAAYAMT
ncbi:MAG TPA: ATP-binding protein, partial [Capillimicrobium sp.]|nr:ATP-binding protein [Capillimicrobium sp.]